MGVCSQWKGLGSGPAEGWHRATWVLREERWVTQEGAVTRWDMVSFLEGSFLRNEPQGYSLVEGSSAFYGRVWQSLDGGHI